jgi:hypothetical protein
METEYLQIPQLAYRCSLPIFPSDGIWEPEDHETLKIASEKSGEVFIVAYAVVRY